VSLSSLIKRSLQTYSVAVLYILTPGVPVLNPGGSSLSPMNVDNCGMIGPVISLGCLISSVRVILVFSRKKSKRMIPTVRYSRRS
jgi:hypothetical protein